MSNETSDVETLRRRLAYWRERLQAVGNMCRGGAQRGEALREIQVLEEAIGRLAGRTAAEALSSAESIRGKIKI
jgi:hypothetical protein